jgi:hypothetical protein
MASKYFPYYSMTPYSNYSRDNNVFDILNKSTNNNEQYMGNTCNDMSYCGVEIIPTAEYLNTRVLLTANPPPGSTTQPASEWRPGNDYNIQYGTKCNIKCALSD